MCTCSHNSQIRSDKLSRCIVNPMRNMELEIWRSVREGTLLCVLILCMFCHTTLVNLPDIDM